MSDCCLYLRGEFFIKDASDDCLTCEEITTGGNYRKIGNTSLCEVTINSLLNGKENKYNKVNPKNRLAITSVDLAMTIECASRENLLLAFNAENEEVNQELRNERICYGGEEFLILNYRPDGDVVITGKDSFGNDVQTLELDVDYRIVASKIELLNVNEDVITLYVSYISKESINSLTLKKENARYKELYFVGENASSGESVDVRFFRVLFNPISAFDIVSKDQLFNLPLVGVVEESAHGYFKMNITGEPNESGEVIY